MEHETTLRSDEIETLIDALKAWENKDLASDVMIDLIDTAFLDKATRQTDKYTSERDKRKAEREAAQRQRKETSVLLQAKLIRMRNAADVDTFIAGALGSGSA